MLNWWIGSILIPAALGPPAFLPAIEFQMPGLPVSAQRLPEATPADLTTLTTPATKPSSKNTMKPNGDVDNKRSKPQPIPAPTTTPATNSEERRKPSAMPEALAALSPLSVPGWSVLILRLSRISDNRLSRLPSLAESAASSEDD